METDLKKLYKEEYPLWTLYWSIEKATSTRQRLETIQFTFINCLYDEIE